MFVRNCWYVAGWDSDVTAEGPVARTILNEPIVFTGPATEDWWPSPIDAAIGSRRSPWAGSRATTSAACTTA